MVLFIPSFRLNVNDFKLSISYYRDSRGRKVTVSELAGLGLSSYPLCFNVGYVLFQYSVVCPYLYFISFLYLDFYFFYFHSSEPILVKLLEITCHSLNMFKF